jgi:hypothetical protein
MVDFWRLKLQVISGTIRLLKDHSIGKWCLQLISGTSGAVLVLVVMLSYGGLACLTVTERRLPHIWQPSQ